MTFLAVLAALAVYDLAKLTVKALIALAFACICVLVGTVWLTVATAARLGRAASR